MPLDIQLVGDDSGTKGTGTHLVMGGMIASADVWAAFANDWSACLKQSPEIRYFKMREAAKRDRQFARFKKKQRDDKLVALTDVINSYPLLALHVSVNLADQEADTAHWRPQRRKGGSQFEQDMNYLSATAAHPYYDVYMNFVVAACVDLWHEGVREQFDFIVDEHLSLGARTAVWYPAIRASVPEPLRSIMPTAPLPRNDESFLPLQAADMIAGLERMSVEGRRDFEWVAKRIVVPHAPHCIRIDKARYARNRKIVAAKGGETALVIAAMEATLQDVPLDSPLRAAVEAWFAANVPQ